MVKRAAALAEDAICRAYMLMGREDKQQHNKSKDVSGDCCGYGGSMEPVCNLNLDELERLHDLTERSILESRYVLADLQELEDEGAGRGGQLLLLCCNGNC
ncbi:MAG: hypothetical protein IJI61_03410 [Oscillospiraceae bacterium]|nr:hypothetical protein [Oscillospiraceae bacterium]